MHDLTSRLIDILVTRFNVERGAIGPDVTLDDLDLDSLVLVELAVIVERELGVYVEEGEISLEQTASQAAAVIRGHLEAAGRPPAGRGVA
jgi:acyl carrier protein